MRFLNGIQQKPGTISGATNGTAVKSSSGGQIALHLSAQISFTGSSETTASAQLQKSNDGTNWSNEGSAITISGSSGVIWAEKQNNTALYWRIQYACGGGSFVPTELWNLLG